MTYHTEIDVLRHSDVNLTSGTRSELLSQPLRLTLTCPGSEPYSYTVNPREAPIGVEESTTSKGGSTVVSRTKETNPGSFKKIVRSGTIKMTPYSRSRVEGRKEVARVYFSDVESFTDYRTNGGNWSNHGLATNDFNIASCTYPNGHIALTNSALIGQAVSGGWKINPTTGRYQPVTITERWRDVTYNETYMPPPLKSVSADIEVLKASLVSKLYKRWDLMTDLVEAKASYQTLLSVVGKSRAPISSLREAMGSRRRNETLSLRQGAKASSSQWLEYRYGIMPMVYSATDALKVLSKLSVEYDTVRGSFVEDVSDVFTRGKYIIRRTGSVDVRATAKARYESSLSRAQGSISTNLINTAWETTRYSLVVDWFVNVGDFLTATTTAFKAEHSMCYAQKVTYTDQVYEVIDDREYLVYTHSVDSYDRVPFTNRDITLQFRNNFSGWKRWLDAIALSAGPLTKALRRLK